MPLNCISLIVSLLKLIICVNGMIYFHMVILWAVQRLLGAHEETNADVHTECPVSVLAFREMVYQRSFFFFLALCNGQVELSEK